MIFNGSVKILIFCMLSLIGDIQARSLSHSQFGDIRIEQVNGKWLCDKIECPVDTYRCYVTKSNEKDHSVLVRTNICYSEDGKTLREQVSSTPIDPNSNIKTVINNYRDGSTTSSFNTFTDANYDDEKFKKAMEEFESNLHDQMKELNENLSHMFDHFN